MTNRIIHTSDDLPREHWIARQLPAGTSLRPYAEDEAISVLTSAAQEAIEEAGLTRSQVAELLGTTRSYVSQVLNGSTNMTLRTLGALFWAAGRQVAGVVSEPLGTTPTAHAYTWPSVADYAQGSFRIQTTKDPMTVYVAGSALNRLSQRWDNTLQHSTLYAN